MKITKWMRFKAWIVSIRRIPVRILREFAHGHGYGAYRPYLHGEIPVGDLVLNANHPAQIVIGSGSRESELVSIVGGGNLPYISLSNDAKINTISFFDNYRYIDGTRCGKFVWSASQSLMDSAWEQRRRSLFGGYQDKWAGAVG